MTTRVGHFVYQRIHALKGKALHLADHLRIASRAYEHIYGVGPEIDERFLAAGIAEALRKHHSASRTGATLILSFAPHDDSSSPSLRGAEGDEAIQVFIEYERSLLEAGYSHSALRPKAWSYDYAIPFGGFPTGFQLSARELFDTLAFSRHGATRSVRREGDRLISCGDSPLFGIRGRVLFTAPLTEGATDSVERSLVLGAAGGAKSRLTIREEPVLHPELRTFDELFFADAAGITSLSECDGARFMSLAAPRLAAAMK